MKTINNELIVNELVFKKSRFITYIKPVSTKEDAMKFLEVNKHLDARHNCYAYKIGISNQSASFSDDGEPAKTAGRPIFNVIEKNDLTNVVILVVRYFGGIKLGAGPLTRAYSKSASSILSLCSFSELKSAFLITIKYLKTNIKDINHWIRTNNIQIKETRYIGDEIYCDFYCDDVGKLKNVDLINIFSQTQVLIEINNQML